MKLKALAGTCLLTFLSVAIANAQAVENPCGGTDIDVSTCPIDTWVVVLVAVSAMFATYTLLKRKKSFANLTVG